MSIDVNRYIFRNDFFTLNQDSSPVELKKTHHDEVLLLKEMAGSGMEQRISPKGKVEVQIQFLSEKTTLLLMKLNNLNPIQSLILAENNQGSQISFLSEIAPFLTGIDELIVTDVSIHGTAIEELIKLFPKLIAFGNDAPFLKSADEVKAYLESFNNPGFVNQDWKKLRLLSLNLEAIPHLTNKEFDELTNYLLEMDRLFIKSDRITRIVLPVARQLVCRYCTNLATLVAHKSEQIICISCNRLSTLEAHQAKVIECSCCRSLTNLEAPQAEKINCYSCISLKTLKAHNAKKIFCFNCKSLSTLEAPHAIKIDCRKCSNLSILNAPQAKEILK